MINHKICMSCGREMEYRKKWAKNWDQVKFCSDSCRKNKNEFDYREKILDLLKNRKFGDTICPSEVLEFEQKKDPILIEHVRRSARLLVLEGIIDITQKGCIVDPSDFRGPIRLRLKK